MISPKERHGD